MLKMRGILMMFLIGQVKTLELQLIMDKLNDIDSKVGRLFDAISNIETKMNESKQRSNDISTRVKEITEHLSAFKQVKDDAVNADKYGGQEHFDELDFNKDNDKTRNIKEVRKRRQATGTHNDPNHIHEGKRSSLLESSASETYLSYINDTVHQMNDTMMFHLGDIIERLDYVEETLQSVVEDRSYMSKDIQSVSKTVEKFAFELSDAVQDTCNSDHVIKKIDHVLRDVDLVGQAVNTTTDIVHNINETLKIHKLESTHDSVGNFKSCADLKLSYKTSGIYNTKYTRVYCDQETDGGGWTVFQRRQDGSENFNRSWNDYKFGFGDMNNEFWLGNEFLSVLTRSCNCELFINMTSYDDFSLYARYSRFKVHPESNGYKLEVDGFSGDAEEGLKYHNGMSFSTYDRDNDYNEGSCAESWKSGWWYRDCYDSDLNGVYSLSKDSDLVWQRYALTYVEMKFRC